MTNIVCSEPSEDAIAQSSSTAPVLALSLSHNFAWALAGNVTFAACQGANLVLLAKATDPTMVGRFALALAITAPLFLLTNLQLRAIQATDSQAQYRFGNYLALRLLTTCIALGLLPLIVMSAGYAWSLAAVALMIGVGKSFDAINDVMYGLVQKHERLDRGGFARIVAGFGTVAGLGTLLYFTGSLFWAATGWALGHGIVTFTAPYWVGSEIVALESELASPKLFAPIWDRDRLVQLGLLSLPMGLVMMLGSLQLNAPRYFIEHYLDERFLGIYAAIAYVMLAGNMISLAMGQAVTPRMAKHFAAAEFKSYFGILGRLMGLSVLGGIVAVAVAWLAGEWILTLLFTAEYAQYSSVLVCLAAVLGIETATSFMGEAMTSTRRFRIQMPVLLAALLAAAIACVVLIPRYELMGAAIATGVGAFTQLLGSTWVVSWAVQQRRKEEA